MANLYRCGGAALDGDAVESNVLNGKTFYKDNASTKLTGTMTNRGAVSKTLDATSGNQSYTIPAGYHNGSGKVQISLETKTVTPNSVQQNITPSSGKVLSKVTVSPIITQEVTKEVTIAGAYQTGVTSTFTFSNMTTVIGVTSIKKTSGSGAVTLLPQIPSTFTIPTSISGNKVTLTFQNNSDATNQSATIKVTAKGV